MGQRLVKTINFDKYKDVGNPVSTQKFLMTQMLTS